MVKVSEKVLGNVRKLEDKLNIKYEEFWTNRDTVQLEFEHRHHYLEFEVFSDRVEVFKSVGDKGEEEEFIISLDELDRANLVILGFLQKTIVYDYFGR